MRHLAPGFIGSALLFVVACGGKVVVDASGSGATGGAGAGGNSGTGGDLTSTGDVNPVGSTVAVAAVSSSGGGPDLCTQACVVQGEKGCGTPDCVASCQQAYATAGVCKPLLDALATCIINSTDPDCKSPKDCEGASSAYSSCIQPGGCDGTVCSGSGDGSCACKGICKGINVEEQCTPGNATNFCTCFHDGTIVGTCTEPQSSGNSCDLVKGCCATQFGP